MFFSKQFFVRSYHEILTQGVVLATLRRHHLGSHLWFLFESPWSAVSFELALERQKRKKNLERNELIENLIFIILNKFFFYFLF